MDPRTGATAEAEISYKPDSYEGLGQLTVKDEPGTTVKGSGVLSGRRVRIASAFHLPRLTGEAGEGAGLGKRRPQ